MSNTYSSLTKRWVFRVLQPSELESRLQLPDFTTSSTPTRDLSENIKQLTRIHLPKWHRGVTIWFDVMFTLYLVFGFAVLIYRWRNRSIWLFRMQQGHIVPNGLNAFALLAGCYVIMWGAYSSVKLRGGYHPAAPILYVPTLWVGAWVAAYGSAYSIPSTSVFKGRSFTAKQMNAVFIGVPLVFCIHTISIGIAHCVRYGEAMTLYNSFQLMLRLQPDTAPVTQSQLEEAVKVWASIISAYTYGSLFQVTCGAWALVVCSFYSFVLFRLLSQLKKQRRSHSQSSKAGAQVSPEWKEVSDGSAMESPPLAKHFEALQDDEENVKLFFPPFNPASSAATDPTDVLFRKVWTNLVTTGAFAIFAFLFLACACFFWGLAPPWALEKSSREPFRVVHLVMELFISGATVLAGAVVCLEIITQSLQPVLGSWEYDSALSTSPKAHALLGTKLRHLTFLDRVSRIVPAATRSQLERLSRPSFFETKSEPAPVLHRRFSMPGAPRALAFPEIGEEEECSESESTIEAGPEGSGTIGAYEGTHSTYAIDAKQERREVRSTLSHTPAQRELELRVLPPSSGERTRVYFIRETQTTYETVRFPRRAAAPRRSEEVYRPTWRDPATRRS